MHTCGVSLGHSPRSVTFKGIRAKPLAQRESLLLYFKYLGVPPAVVRMRRPATARCWGGSTRVACGGDLGGGGT